MSDNKMLNAILAYVEGYPERARTYLRSPEFTGTGVRAGDIQLRLESSLDKARLVKTVEVLREILRRTLTIEPDPDKGVDTQEAYMRGVQTVEGLIETQLLRYQEILKDRNF